MTPMGGEVTVENPADLARTARERRNLYGFLANIFRREPTPALLRDITEPRVLEAFDAAGVNLNGDLFSDDEEALLLDLAVEFTRLFIGPGRHVPPLASVHLSAEGGQRFSALTWEIKRFIEEKGFSFKRQFHDLPDHISVLLEVMAQLTGRESKAWLKADTTRAVSCVETELDFLESYLSGWVPRFCRKVTEVAELPFYREMAALTDEFIRAERGEIVRRRRCGALRAGA